MPVKDAPQVALALTVQTPVPEPAIPAPQRREVIYVPAIANAPHGPAAVGREGTENAPETQALGTFPQTGFTPA